MFAAVIALGSFSVLHLRGIGLTPDGWAYWQGAVSLVAGRGYRYFSGARIVAWPPFYSLYLAAWLLAVGPTALSLIIANAALVAVQASFWCWTLLTIWRETTSGAPRADAVAAVVVYLGLFIPINEQAVLADVLKYTLLPLLLMASWKAWNSMEAVGVVRWTALSAAAATILLLVHNNSIAFIAANSLLLFLGTGKRLHRALAAVVSGAVPMGIWIIVRHALQQDHSHFLGFGVGRYSAWMYTLQLLRGTGSLIVPDRRGAPFVAIAAAVVLFGILVRRREGSTALFFGGAFVGTSVAVTYALFNVSWVHDPLTGRFLLFLPLVIIPLLFLASADWNRAVFLISIAVVICPQFYWTATSFAFKTKSSLQELEYPTRFVTPDARLSVDYRLGPPKRTGQGVVLAPSGREEQPERTK
jgi:hypothetical protein